MIPNNIQAIEEPLHLGCLVRKYAIPGKMDLTNQWIEFLRYFPKLKSGNLNMTYGVCWHISDDEMEYWAATKVNPADQLPSEFEHRSLKAHEYGVFLHEGHVSELSKTVDAIFKGWDEAYEYQPDFNNRFFFEKYGPSFHPQTGLGGVEVWVPVIKQ